MRMTRALMALALALALTLGAAPTGALSALAASEGAVVDARLLTALMNSTEPVSAVVTFDGEGAPAESQLTLLRQAGVTQGFRFQSLPMAGVLVTKAQVDVLAAMPGVRSIYLNAPLQYYNADATALTGVDRVRSDPTMTAHNGGMPISGRGVGVVINDSGVDGTHQDIAFGRNLKQNVLGSTNPHAYSDLLPITYVENVPNTDTNSGHGTHVAGIVGGTGTASGGKYEGVAPGAALIGYGSGAALFILDGLGGFDYALTHQIEYGVRVVTNSWGTTGSFDPNDPINIATYLLYKRNIAVTFAAGNQGPGEDTHNPYAQAPWVISVAAGDKHGRLADFSSRGVKDKGGAFTLDGQTWTWEDRPTITAPGVDIISCRAVAPVSSLAASDDATMIEPAYLPYYTVMSGTSMATPHVAGIVALMLEANPRLTPTEIKQILQQTATNIPGREPWEAGAGYVNAYAAVDRSFQTRDYGLTLNMGRRFNSNINLSITRSPFTVDYNPVTLISTNRVPFTVPAGVTELAGRVNAYGLMEQTGNPINLVLIAPDGTEYSSGISLLFLLYPERTVSVTSPQPGAWTLELRGLRGNELNPTDGAALPEKVQGTLIFKTAAGDSGLNDIAGDPAEAAIRMAVGERLVDGHSDGTFKPDEALTRREMANYLVMGAEIRQFLPLDGSSTFKDVGSGDLPFVEAVAARGAALRDRAQTGRGVMLPTGTDAFSPKRSIRRVDLAFALVQSLGLESEAAARNSDTVTVQYGDSRIPIDDALDIPADLRGHVQLALDLNILNAYFTLTQGPYDLQPTVHATFKPLQTVTRGDYAVAVTRFFTTYLSD